jgi:endonuclease YncB( thermonuclease family)
MDQPSLWDGLASVSLAELRTTRQRLDDEFDRHLALLDALEAHKTELDQRGAAERSLRAQRALARRVADLDRQAAHQARLLRLVGKQQRLLDRLIWARESVQRWEALRASAPAALELDWADLAGAATDLAGTEARLDGLLRILGVPEEEWPDAGQPMPEPHPELLAERDPDQPVLVAQVLDGRSLRLVTGETVRYIGVDAPLLRGPLGQPDVGSQKAWQANRRLVEGQYVRMEADTEDRDADGALWRYVWVGKTCVNAELIGQGYAYHQPLSPNYRHSEWFSQLEDKARRKKRGVWP